ncbi:MAG: Dipeptidyl aminopeptidase BIII [candidate division WS2 bacterium]|nr:Dipeptidyl aminopeptidase BIII [Bacillota bacterium]MBT9150714.1 Dipeptidyl aminopeptidase BIII [Candidatus Psychracetigena formicireducens]
MKPEEYLDALLSLPGMEEPTVSPDGRWVAWSWYRVGPAADVFIAPADGSLPPIRLTETPENTFIASWTQDSQSLVVGEDKGGDERVQLYKINLDKPGIMIPLTEPSPPYYISGGQLHPDKKHLIYTANYDFEKGEEIEPAWLYLHNLETGKRKVLARPERSHFYFPELNSRGTHIIYSRGDLHPAGQQIWSVDIEGKEDKEILNFGDTVKVEASWHPDGENIIFLTEHGNYRRVGLYNLTSGKHHWILDNPERNIEQAFVPYGSALAVIVEVKEAKLSTSLLDIESGLETFLPFIKGNLIPLAPVGNNKWVGLYYSSCQPTDVVRFSLNNIHLESFISISRVWEKTMLNPEDFTPAKDYWWRSTDGLNIQGWLYEVNEPIGTIIYVHGGPTAHDEDQVDLKAQFLTSQGFNVLNPNYRGSTGFGLDFQEAIKKDGWGAKEQDDIKTGIESLINAGIACAGKVGMIGTSYGGYSSWFAITHWEKDLIAASMPICGMTDLVVDYETTRPDLRPYSEEMMGGSPKEVPQLYFERSPINYLQNIKGKILIVQGLRDPNVTPENVRVVREKLDYYGINYELLTFEDEGHGINKPKNLKVLVLKMVEFFKQAF